MDRRTLWTTSPLILLGLIFCFITINREFRYRSLDKKELECLRVLYHEQNAEIEMLERQCELYRHMLKEIRVELDKGDEFVRQVSKRLKEMTEE